MVARWLLLEISETQTTEASSNLNDNFPLSLLPTIPEFQCHLSASFRRIDDLHIYLLYY